MLRINLSTRPFYNERLVSLLIAVAGVVSVGVMVFCVQQIVSLSSQRTTLRAQMAQDAATTARANEEALALSHSVDQPGLKGLAANATQANRLIDERTFSWTVFFSLIGKTLPNDVRIDSVAPSIDKDGVVVLMTVVSKRTDDLAAFIENLQKTGAFYDILPQKEDATNDGMRRTSVSARYLSPKTAAPEGSGGAATPQTPPAEVK